MHVGFVGLGQMGRGMVARLIQAGHEVKIWNRSRGPVDELTKLGASAARDPADAFQSEVVISMLADDSSVRSVILDSGALSKARKNVIHVNMATISVALAEELGRAHAEAGLKYIAAPVFGRPNAAASGQLHIIAAGANDDIDRVEPLLAALGQRIWRMGTNPSRANSVKLAGNFMIASAIETMAEAMALTQSHGVAASDFHELMTNTLFSAPIYKNYGTLIANRNYEPAGFRLSLGLKDVRLALSAAEAKNVPMPFASVLRDGFLEAVARGEGEKDWTALADVEFRRAALISSEIDSSPKASTHRS